MKTISEVLDITNENFARQVILQHRVWLDSGQTFFFLCPVYEMQKSNAPTNVGILW